MGPASRRHLARDAPGAPEGSQELFYSHSRRAGAPRRLPEAVLQPFQGGGVPRRLPGTVLQPFQGGTRGPEGTQERFYRHSQGWGPPEGSQERFCNHSLQPFQGPFQAGRAPQKAPRTPRMLPGAVLQPFQGGRGPRRTLAPRRGRAGCSFNDPLRGVCSL